MQIANPARRFDYVLRDDRDSDAPTVFTLRRLTWEELAEVQACAAALADADAVKLAALTEPARRDGRDLTPEEVERVVAEVPDWHKALAPALRLHARACHYGLVAIAHLRDETGAPLELDPVKFIRAAAAHHITELGEEILRISRLTVDDRKNSAAPRVPGRRTARATTAR